MGIRVRFDNDVQRHSVFRLTPNVQRLISSTWQTSLKRIFARKLPVSVEFGCIFRVRRYETGKTNIAEFFRSIFPSGFSSVYSRNRAFYSCAVFQFQGIRIQTMANGTLLVAAMYSTRTEIREYLLIDAIIFEMPLTKSSWEFFSDLRRTLSPRFSAYLKIFFIKMMAWLLSLYMVAEGRRTLGIFSRISHEFVIGVDCDFVPP